MVERGVGESMREMGKDFCPNSPQLFLENVDRKSCNDGSRELIPVYIYIYHLWERSEKAVVTHMAVNITFF